jgi:hypothetical protein
MNYRTFSRLAALVAASMMIGFAAPAPAQDDYSAPLTELANGKLREIAQNPVLVSAIMAQNEQTAAYDQAKIDALDKQWRAEVDAAAKPLIDATLATDASKYLSSVQADSAGLFTEIFATDNKGLNVAQSTVTSDYWQGDEDKFSKSFGMGADAVFLGDVEQDESTQTYQSQVSITITDPATGAPIGSITAGVDLSAL